MESLKFYLRTLFGFSAREVNGFIILASIMFVSLTIPPVYDQLLPPALPKVKPSEIFKSSIPSKSFAFDPNGANTEELIALGFSKQVSTRIEKFRSAGGKFYKPEDLLKIYGMDSVLFSKLKDSIVIEEQRSPRWTKNKFERRDRFYDNKNEEKYSAKSFTPKQLDINTCDSAQLETLRGIGPALASRIIKYRQKLGGFIDTSQFKEVYGLKDFSLEELKRMTFIANGFSPEKIFINTATQEILGAHPYIGWKAAKIIINWRKQHGVINDENQLVEINAVQNVQRIRRYVMY